MDFLINTAKSYLSPVSPQLNGKDRDTFCFLSIRDRHPVTITKIIDAIFKLGCKNSNLETDTKNVVAFLSRLKNRLQTDKDLELIECSEDDVGYWNSTIKELADDGKSWFTAPWLTVECYMYRMIHKAFQDTVNLKYPEFDVFRQEKTDGTLSSISNMGKLSELFCKSDDMFQNLIALFIKISLWGNRADLSILKHFNLDLSDMQQSANIDKNDEMILNNDTEKIVSHLTSLNDGHIGIILDNSGYELFGDLCLAECLIRTNQVNKITFHMKSIPWFVSDVTEYDMDFLLQALKSSDDSNLQSLGNTWFKRFEKGQFVRTDHLFWTTPNGFWKMKSVSPDLYNELSGYDLLFFKGDLNYRKLVNDRQWPYDTSFKTALEGFNPTKLCALRTIKSDSIVACSVDKVKHILETDKDRIYSGAYALVSSNII